MKSRKLIWILSVAVSANRISTSTLWSKVQNGVQWCYCSISHLLNTQRSMFKSWSVPAATSDSLSQWNCSGTDFGTRLHSKEEIVNADTDGKTQEAVYMSAVYSVFIKRSEQINSRISYTWTHQQDAKPRLRQGRLQAKAIFSRNLVRKVSVSWARALLTVKGMLAQDIEHDRNILYASSTLT